AGNESLFHARPTRKRFFYCPPRPGPGGGGGSSPDQLTSRDGPSRRGAPVVLRAARPTTPRAGRGRRDTARGPPAGGIPALRDVRGAGGTRNETRNPKEGTPCWF